MDSRVRRQEGPDKDRSQDQSQRFRAGSGFGLKKKHRRARKKRHDTTRSRGEAATRLGRSRRGGRGGRGGQGRDGEERLIGGRAPRRVGLPSVSNNWGRWLITRRVSPSASFTASRARRHGTARRTAHPVIHRSTRTEHTADLFSQPACLHISSSSSPSSPTHHPISTPTPSTPSTTDNPTTLNPHRTHTDTSPPAPTRHAPTLFPTSTSPRPDRQTPRPLGPADHHPPPLASLPLASPRPHGPHPPRHTLDSCWPANPPEKKLDHTTTPKSNRPRGI